MIAQNVFWAVICLKLTNRVMSRNYQEIAQADKKPEPFRPMIADDEADPVAERQAKELNSIMGVV